MRPILFINGTLHLQADKLTTSHSSSSLIFPSNVILTLSSKLKQGPFNGNVWENFLLIT